MRPAASMAGVFAYTEPQKQSDVEAAFWAFFKDKVSEWNPCFSDGGKQRVGFVWDPEVGAHDIEVDVPRFAAMGVDEVEPTRSRLRTLLDCFIC